MKTFYSHLDFHGNGSTRALFSGAYGMKEVRDPANADIIIWNGGEDIATSIYNEDPVQAGIPFHMSNRDRSEIEMFKQFADDPTKLLFGICRGAQLLNCLNGGRLYQDVDGHNGSHSMLDLNTEEVVYITSTHHQQMIPGVDGVLIGVSSCSTYKVNAKHGIKYFKKTDDLEKGADAEVVWYPKHRSLCVQGHPEYVPGSRFSKYTLELLNKYFTESVASAA